MENVADRGREHPAVEELHAAKEKRRRVLAALPIEEKLAIAFGYEQMLRPIRRWRTLRSGLKNRAASWKSLSELGRQGYVRRAGGNAGRRSGDQGFVRDWPKKAGVGGRGQPFSI